MKVSITVFFTFLMFCFSYSQQDTSNSKKPPVILKQGVFATIFAGYYYGLNENAVPRSAFSMPTAILGYKKELSETVKAIILYDVTRTTNFSYTDSSGISGYFEGSKYTAFLKMAQIDWKINSKIELSVGQMLNEQYLTVQDKWWDHRYVDVSFQEKYKFGMPADFGARIAYSVTDKLKITAGAVNGEGPFRYQDTDARFLYSGNIEYMPKEKIILKLYGDYQTVKNDSSSARSAISGFAGYKGDKLMVGGEYNMVMNPDYLKNSDFDFSGFSFYTGYKITSKFEAFGRFDRIESATGIEKSNYYIIGVQYSPANNYNISVNYRNYTPAEIPVIYANFGIKF